MKYVKQVSFQIDRFSCLKIAKEVMHKWHNQAVFPCARKSNRFIFVFFFFFGNCFGNWELYDSFNGTKQEQESPLNQFNLQQQIEAAIADETATNLHQLQYTRATVPIQNAVNR